MYNFKTSVVYERNWISPADIVVNQGGTDSGKTYAIMQILWTICTTTKAPEVDPVVTVVGESVPNLKAGAYRIAKSIYSSNPGLAYYVRFWNETERTIYFRNGWIMEFRSYADEQNAKQGKRQFSFFNEANGLSYGIFWQVAKRTRQKVFVDYNPSEPFWAHEKLIGTNPATNDLGARVELLISDHRHNPFLSDRDHAKTENIKDPELWKVYARGVTGNLTGIVFPNWVRIPDDQFPTDVDIFGGLDFGYTNDPTAGVKIARIGESIYLHELCYEPGISATNTRAVFFAAGFNEETEIFCENDEDQIRELRAVGLKALFARKGQGSVKGGIKKLNEFKVYYTASSLNLHKERQKYMYITDKITGRPTNVPIDAFNHLMDAGRMGVYTKFHRHGAK
jgi:phage terminase large subunit